NERTWRLGTTEHQASTLPFKRGDQVVITVTSNGPSDIDVFVFDAKNKMNSTLTSTLLLEKNVYRSLTDDNALSMDGEVKSSSPARVSTGLPELPPMVSEVATKLNGVLRFNFPLAASQRLGMSKGGLLPISSARLKAPAKVV